MSETLCTAPRCSYNQNNGFLCRNCVDVLRRDLSAVSWLIEDLEVTITRQDLIAEPSGRSGDEHPLPLNMNAIEAKDILHMTLAAWGGHIAGRLDGLGAGVWDEIRLADFLLDNINTICTDPAAGQLADEIGAARGQAQRAIDKPVPRVYVGPCEDCDKDLYAHPSAAEIECKTPDCGAIYPIEARRRWLLGKAEDQLMTATELSRALPGLLRRPITPAMIRGYAHRGRLTQHPPLPDKPKDPVYRCGDVISLLNEIADEQAGRPKDCVA